jgi:UTP--glucose-1-phosphate uridylyltransferase
MADRVRKAVFPVAGLGTRFLPATKAMPKEMLTVIDRPLIQHVVEEAMEAGIEEFIFVTSPNKHAILEHFSRQPELEKVLAARGKTKELESLIKGFPAQETTKFVEQREPLGLGHAVWCARDLVGNESFALLLPDVLVQTAGKGCLAQMLDVYAQVGGNIIAVEQVPKDRAKNYGIVSVGRGDGKVFPIGGMVEKPKPGTEPSDLAILGRYVLQPEIFGILSTQEKGAGGEIQLTDAMLALMKTEPFYAVKVEGRVFDCGATAGFLRANVAYALAQPDLGDIIAAELKR